MIVWFFIISLFSFVYSYSYDHFLLTSVQVQTVCTPAYFKFLGPANYYKNKRFRWFGISIRCWIILDHSNNLRVFVKNFFLLLRFFAFRKTLFWLFCLKCVQYKYIYSYRMNVLVSFWLKWIFVLHIAWGKIILCRIWAPLADGFYEINWIKLFLGLK